LNLVELRLIDLAAGLEAIVERIRAECAGLWHAGWRTRRSAKQIAQEILEEPAAR
jgi:hypothetical protein